MTKKIYLPSSAKNQLETSDDSSIWTEPISFRDKPENGFTSEIVLSEDTLELGVDYVLEGGFYHPDRDQDLTSTIESIKIVPDELKTKYQFIYYLQTKNMFDHGDIETVLSLTAEFDYPNSENERDQYRRRHFILDPKKKIVVRVTSDKRFVPRNMYGLVELTEEAYNAGLWEMEKLASGSKFKKRRTKKAT